jgi:hypothetical protein
MARKFLVSIDLTKNELQNAVIQNLATAPSTPVAGQIYYNTVDNQLYIYNGTRWEVAGNAVTSGLLANRPAANSVDAGTIYYATDNQLFYYSDGSTWTQTNTFGTVTSQTTYGASSGNGTSTNYARADHTHGTPSLGTSTPNAVAGVTGSAGSATVPSKEDHTHALVPTANIDWAGYKITTLGAPSADGDAANKGYVDSVAQGLDIKASVRLATTGALSAYTFTSTGGGTITSDVNGALSIDGVTPSVADRILVKNEISGNAPYNGIYVVTTVGDGSTPYVLTRASDANTSSEVTSGMFTFVEQGTTNDNTGWVLTTNNPITLNTTDLVFAQFSGAGTYTASNGVLLTGSNFTFAPRSGYGLQTGSSGAEIKLATTSGLNLTTDLAVGAGNGISVLTNTVAIDSAVVVSKYAANVGDGSATSYTVTHNLGTKDVIVSLYDNSSPYAEVICDVQHTSTSAITLVFSTAPTSNQYRVVVHG